MEGWRDEIGQGMGGNVLGMEDGVALRGFKRCSPGWDGMEKKGG